MRLNQLEIEAIRETKNKIFGQNTKIFLFGSRVDETKRGGDIDLYLYSKDKIEDKLNKKIKFLIELEDRLGEQKIDFIINDINRDNLIDKEALNGIEL